MIIARDQKEKMMSKAGDQHNRRVGRSSAVGLLGQAESGEEGHRPELNQVIEHVLILAV